MLALLRSPYSKVKAGSFVAQQGGSSKAFFRGCAPRLRGRHGGGCKQGWWVMGGPHRPGTVWRMRSLVAEMLAGRLLSHRGRAACAGAIILANLQQQGTHAEHAFITARSVLMMPVAPCSPSWLPWLRLTMGSPLLAQP